MDVTQRGEQTAVHSEPSVAEDAKKQEGLSAVFQTSQEEQMDVPAQEMTEPFVCCYQWRSSQIGLSRLFCLGNIAPSLPNTDPIQGKELTVQT